MANLLQTMVRAGNNLQHCAVYQVAGDDGSLQAVPGPRKGPRLAANTENVYSIYILALQLRTERVGLRVWCHFNRRDGVHDRYWC